ncbi:DsbA family oxidoreductase [Methylocapsa acidiphila]|uniref:DsbA family oxidoreductase n=1 Tax=Methylocapsa acidiphila TaxID=133552 RepID=UPI00040482C1|nr:DsbA family oxidoreductase [Methylocapsa acidiphila]
MSLSRAENILSIDVIADVVCPWCYIAKRRLEAAIAAQEAKVHLRWRPFQIDRGIPEGGLAWRTYLAKKYGDDLADDALEALAAAGRDAGLSFAFDKIERMPNSLDAHRLVRFAKFAALESRMVERLFKAFFTEGRDIGDRRLLIELGVETGLDREILEESFADGQDAQSVKDEMTTTRRLALAGAPMVIFGEDVVVPGAQSKEVYAAALVKAREAHPRVG